MPNGKFPEAVISAGLAAGACLVGCAFNSANAQTAVQREQIATNSRTFIFSDTTKAQSAPGQHVLGSSAYEYTSLKGTTNEHGLFTRVFTSPTATLSNLECHITTLNPGLASHAPHHHPEEEIVIIRQGTVEALVNGEWKRIGPGSIVFNACNITHDLRNVGDTPALYHVFSWKSKLTPAMTTHTDTIEDSRFTPTPGIMGPTVIDWNSVPPQTNASGTVTRKFFDSAIATAKEFECHETTVNAGQSTHAPSTHPDAREEAIVVEDGTVEAYVGDKWQQVGPGSVIFNAAHQMQAIRNVGNTPATYFVLMWQIPGT